MCDVQVGRGAVLMGYLPLERYQVSIGAGAVVEGQAFVEGHYLEALAFTYSTCRWVNGWLELGLVHWQTYRKLAGGLAAADMHVTYGAVILLYVSFATS